jgi:CRP-like cAMP-binding protein
MSSEPPASGLSPELLQALHHAKPVRRFPKGAKLIQEDSVPVGVYVVKSGEVRILLPTGQNERQLLEIAGPGTMIGLSENVAGVTYRITAEAGVDTTAVFIPRAEFLKFLRDHCDFCLQVVRLVSEDLHGLYEKFRSITAHPGRPRQRPTEERLN